MRITRKALLELETQDSSAVESCLGLLGELGLASSKGRRQAELRLDTIDTVNSVQVLDEGDLETCSGSLTRGNRGVSEEVFPNLQRNQ